MCVSSIECNDIYKLELGDIYIGDKRRVSLYEEIRKQTVQTHGYVHRRDS